MNPTLSQYHGNASPGLPVEALALIQPHFIPSEKTTRESLLLRLRDISDHQSWSEFYYNYWKLIFGVARHYGLNETEASEVVQDTLLALARTLPDFRYDRRKGSFRAWLCNQTRWKVFDAIKKRKPTVPLDNLPPEKLLSDDFSGYWDREWKEATLQLAMNRLKNRVSPYLIQLFQLCIEQKIEVSEAARKLGVSRTAVHMALFKIKRLLKKEIQKIEQQGSP